MVYIFEGFERFEGFEGFEGFASLEGTRTCASRGLPRGGGYVAGW